jgi:hypothetical protein
VLPLTLQMHFNFVLSPNLSNHSGLRPEAKLPKEKPPIRVKFSL